MLEIGAPPGDRQRFALQWFLRIRGIHFDAYVEGCIIHIVLHTFAMYDGAPEYIHLSEVEHRAQMQPPPKDAAAEIISSRFVDVLPLDVPQHTGDLYMPP